MINNQIVLYANTTKYLRMNFDVRFTWREHIKVEVNEMKKKTKKI